MRERWLPVVGVPGYEVSDLGRVRSLTRLDIAGRPLRGRVMRKSLAGRGYEFLRLRRNNQYVVRYVHALVLEAFVGPRPRGRETAHLDGSIRNNRLSDLAWKTHRDNEKDKIAHGTSLHGGGHHSAKLRTAEVKRIRSTRVPATVLAEQYGVTPNHVRAIRRRRYRK